MGQRVVSNMIPAPMMHLAWHDEPYLDTADCWGCGLPTDRLSETFYGLPQMPGREPPRRPECRWCGELAEIQDAVHRAVWKARGYDPPPRKPRRPPRGPSGISPGPGGVR
jgi:hypothetical protein